MKKQIIIKAYKLRKYNYIYNSGKQTWHIELMASLEANNDIILHQNLFDIIDMSITDLPDDTGSILGQKRPRVI